MNEIERARISIMAKELTRSYQGPDTETQTCCLRTITLGLQRAGRSIQKCQFGYRKVRYRGLDKNAAQTFSLLALANLYLARRTIARA